MLYNNNEGTPSKTPAVMRVFGTPASRDWSFRPSFTADACAPPVPPFSKLDFGLKDGKTQDDEEDRSDDGMEGRSKQCATTFDSDKHNGGDDAESGNHILGQRARPLPRRSLAAGRGKSHPKTGITARFDKAHANGSQDDSYQRGEKYFEEEKALGGPCVRDAG